MKSKRNYVAILTIHGWQKEVKPRTLITWLRDTADKLEYSPNKIDQTLYRARLIK